MTQPGGRRCAASAPASRASQRGAARVWHSLLLALLGCALLAHVCSGELAVRSDDHSRALRASPSPASSKVQQDVHKKFKFDGRNGPAMALTFIVGALANAVGIGGGAFYVPLFNTLLGFGLKEATALSQAVITGGALASVPIAAAGRHPSDPAKPLLDYDMALMLTPVILFGVSVGVLLNTLLPDWLITFILTALLLWLTFRIGRKSISLYKAEKKGAQLSAQIALEDAQETGGAPEEPPAAAGDAPKPLAAPVAKAGSAPDPEVVASAFRRRSRSANISADTQGLDREGSSSWGAGGDSGCGGSQGLDVAIRAYKPGADGAAGEEAGRKLDGTWREVELSPRLLAKGRGGSASAGPPSPAGGRSPGRGCALEDGIRSLTAFGEHQWGEDGSLVDLRVSDLGAGSSRRAPGASQERATSVRGFDGVERAVAEPLPPLPPQKQQQRQQHDVQQLGEEVSADVDGAKPSRFPVFKILEVLALWCVYVALQLTKTKFQRCSVAYFVIFGCQALLAATTSVLFTWQARTASAREAERPMVQPMLERELYAPPVWTLQTLIRCSLLTLAGGSIAGLLGIGGGMIVSPLLLELGLHPQVAAATSSLMVLFSASSAALSFAFDHLLNIEYALIYGIGCFVSSIGGVLLVNRAVRRSGKASLLVMILAAIIGVGAVLTGVFGGRKAIEALERGEIGFHSFCSA